jgi:integrase
MVNLKAMVHPQQEKEGGIFNIKVRVTKKGNRSFFSTKYFVSKNQLTKDLSKFKDPKVIKSNADLILDYHQRLGKLGTQIDNMSAKEIVIYLSSSANDPAAKKKEINFLGEGFAFADKQTERYRDSFYTTLRSFRDFIHDDVFDVQQLTSGVLYKYEEYLRGPRSGIRMDNFGRMKLKYFKGVSDSTLHHYLTDIRTIFNALRKKYNGEHEDDRLIRHYPFSKYELVDVPQTPKRNLKPILIKLIRDYKDRIYMGTHGTNRVTLAKDIFMLSFYLAGMNTVDLYHIKSYKDGRLNYNRSKTKSRRRDNAYMSIKVQPEAKVILEKYLDLEGPHVFIFHKMYADAQSFNKNVNIGLKGLLKHLRFDESENDKKLISDELDFSHYYSRHSWATIARNICKISKADVSEALNHSSTYDVTDIYIEKDWQPIDEANRKVLDALIEDPESLKVSYEIPDLELT